MTWTISTPPSPWIAHAKTAGDTLEPQAPTGAGLRDLAAIDQPTFVPLIEALCALTPGQVSQEQQDLAGLRPVSEVLRMPDRGDTDDDGDANALNW